MNTFETVKQAIEKRKPISFNYNKMGAISYRVANPYVIYIFVSKAGEQSTKVDVVQTGGDSESKDKNPLPSFRSFLAIEDITHVEILENEVSFGEPLHPDYKPDSDRYENPLAKI